MIDLRPFQTRFLRNAFSPDIDTACLSISRGNGKSTLAAYILTRCMTPGDPWNVPGWEYVLTAATLEQARHVFRPMRTELEPTGEYRFIDSVTRVGITHLASGTRLRVQSSNAKSAMGLVRTPLVIADEPGSWEATGGELMADALFEAQGKPGSPLRIIFIGTLAPAHGGWWHDLVAGGSKGSTYVQSYQGDVETWDKWPTIQKANPLCNGFPEMRKKLLERRDEARASSRLKARFLSYRLNVPAGDESTMLISAEDWQRCETADPPPPIGSGVWGVDLGSGNAMSAISCYHPESGLLRVLATFGGIPDLVARGRADQVGTLYARMFDRGELLIQPGRRVPDVSVFLRESLERWGAPGCIVADRWRAAELRDALEAAACPWAALVLRGQGWKDGAEDVRGFRRAILEDRVTAGRSLLLASALAEARVVTDVAGNSKLAKGSAGGRRSRARDDVAAAAILAVAEGSRRGVVEVGGYRSALV